MSQRNWMDILKLKETGEIQRMGIPFSTKKKDYFYDTGTSKVVELEAEEKKIFNALFDPGTSPEQIDQMITMFGKQEQLLGVINSEHLLDNPVLKQFVQINDYYKEETMKIEQLIIDLTGRCNLRCKYCFYNEYYEGNRNFNTNDISFKTAKKAMDYAYQHRHSEHLSITFYGGEPLLNFEVMKQCIDYALESFVDCNLGFSFTTNLTLMTEEMAEYLGNVPNLSIVLSMDGPAHIHNMARVYSNDRPTFDDAYRGLKLIAKAAKKYGKISLMFNVVLMPPYKEEKFNQISDFFSNLEFLPLGTEVRASYPSKGTVPKSYYINLQEKGDSYITDTNWYEWAEKKSEGKDFISNKLNLYSNILEASLIKIHNRPVYDTPIGISYRNGCCIPGQRRLYVCTDGTYKVCERVGNSPSIGNVDQGIDVYAIEKYYLKKYDCESIKYCSKCWALRLCDICYAQCYDEEGINIGEKCGYCDDTRERLKSWLIKYYEAVEENMDLIHKIDKIKIS